MDQKIRQCQLPSIEAPSQNTMARTRSAKTGPEPSTESVAPSASSQISLTSKTGHPPKLLILPKRASSEARIVALPSPRHGRPSRYLVCPESGVYEFTKVAAPRTTPRSWLIETHIDSPSQVERGDGAKEPEAEVVMNADLYMATEIDPLFLVLPALAESTTPKGSDTKRRMFLTSDDHLEKLPQESSNLSEVLRWPKTRALIESRMAVSCDSVQGGDEIMFRLSEDKLLTVLLDKAKKMSDGGLPPSMEDKFVKRALEAPTLMPSRNANAGQSSNCHVAESQEATPLIEPADSQSSVMSLVAASSSASQPSTSITPAEANDDIPNAVEAPLDVVNLQRLRVAFDFICSTYISSNMAKQLQILLKDSTRVDFAPLNDYLAKVAQLRAEAAATGAFSDFSRKRSRDDEDNEARADRKRKLEEEKKRKANESRGVRDLKKVNTSGMKKMSDFFKAK